MHINEAFVLETDSTSFAQRWDESAQWRITCVRDDGHAEHFSALHINEADAWQDAALRYIEKAAAIIPENQR